MTDKLIIWNDNVIGVNASLLPKFAEVSIHKKPFGSSIEKADTITVTISIPRGQLERDK